MTSSIVVLSAHGSVASGTNLIHMPWFGKSSSPKNAKVQKCTPTRKFYCMEQLWCWPE